MQARIESAPRRRSAIAQAFRLADAPILVSRALKSPAISVTEIKYDRANFGLTSPMPREDAYLVALQLRPCADHDLFFNGRHVRPTNYVEGVTSIYDLRQEPIADLRDPFHSIMFHLPRRALHDIAGPTGAPLSGDLLYRPGASILDPVIQSLLSSLLPAMAKPGEACSLFLDHVALAITAHVAHTYGAMRPLRRLPRGGLAPWQERRAKELLSANLQAAVSLSRLAVECGLSVRHFTRAFRQSTGTPPHRWLLRKRVERAQELLRDSRWPLAEIALACGFADQSHFTRVFTAMVGTSPGTWRRMRM